MIQNPSAITLRGGPMQPEYEGTLGRMDTCV